MKKPLLLGLTPFERPDVKLVLALARSNAFPVLHMGADKHAATEALSALSQQCEQSFGVCFSSTQTLNIPLPDKVSLVIIPYGFPLPSAPGAKIFYQVHSMEEARKAQADEADGIILKGNESAGRVSDESAFIFFQRAIREFRDIDILVQGGVGVHTTAALVALGAAGVVLDSQLVLFPECSAPEHIKKTCEKLSGTETKLIDHYRVLVRPNSPVLPEHARQSALEKFLLPLFDLEKVYLPLGQDIALSSGLVQRYQKTGKLISGLYEAISGHLRQAKARTVIGPGNALTKEFDIPFPIAQGPMTRVSDEPAFAAAVAEAGALPFVALSLLRGESARQLIRETKKLVNGKTWGVGILGFAPQELREEQLEYIKEEKPPVVLIAGGRPSQAAALEQEGIKTLLHVPSVSLLDMFLKEGARRFVFEGRECGGHVGPLSSLVLWEKQIDRLMEEEQAGQLTVFFAGGIHDAFSAAFVAVMAAPLATKGAKVGVLMGTAYLYTKEVVETGAILRQFQDQAITNVNTVLLETAPGHETRCLQSPFADFFTEEKKRLAQAITDKKEIWARLEQLNVGRLRIASKGLDRQNDQLVAVDPETQFREGMYMIGQVAALREKVVSLTELHHNVAVENFQCIQDAVLPETPESGKPLNVAIIGMACIYPGARNLEEYWSNILLGKDCITEVPEERWNKELYYDPLAADGNKTPSKWGGFIPAIDFDPLAFGIPPQSLAAIEPTQLLSLLVAKKALEHSGYGNKEFNAENVSVIIGAEGGNDLANNYGFRALYPQIFGEIPAALDEVLPRLTEDSFPGVLANVIAGRITNRLNLGGRNYTVDAACASSLAAIDLACQELILEKADMVLAGAVDLHNGINDYLMFSSTHALSRTGRCMTFDSAADGIALGEGVAMVVLKRYDDAKRDGDKIYAVIKGVGGSSDGKSLGLTAPRKMGQMKALERAYEQTGVSPAQLGLVEAHGTGTVVGDKTELNALSDMLVRSGAVAGQAHLGSVKTQIGHTKCAAGLAGLIKAALAVYHGVKPPTLHLKTPNSYYNETNSPFLFNTQAGLWMDEKRVAGISAFGFGGTNFHAVIENDHHPSPGTTVMAAWPVEIFLFRGDEYEDARSLLQSVSTLLENNDNIPLKNIAYTLYRYSDQPVQLIIVASDRKDLMLKIDLALSGASAKDVYPVKKQEGKVAFLFPGQGSQRLNMARELLVVFPAMRKLLEKYPGYEKLLFPAAVFNDAALKEQRERIKDTRVAQPLLGIIDLAIASFLEALGLIPGMVAGHSYGEIPALCFARVFEEDQLVPLSEMRAKAILDAIEDDKGGMIAVSCTEEELAHLVQPGDGIFPVNHNSPQQWVLAGASPAIARLKEKLASSNLWYRELEVACAFHSPLLSRSRELYQQAIKDVPFQTPKIPVWSNTTTSVYPDDPAAIKDLLADHLVQPVQFCREIQEMYKHGARIFIEVGPGKVLSNLVRSTLGNEVILLTTEESDQPALPHLLSTLARYMATGRELQLEKLFEGRDLTMLDLGNAVQYKKSSTVWLVNGQLSVPLTGKLPDHGAMPIVTPLVLDKTETKQVAPANSNAEMIIQQYLESVKQLVQAQRDVMLGYLGHSPQVSGMPGLRGGEQQMLPVQPVNAVSKNNSTVHAKKVTDNPDKPKKEEIGNILLSVVSDKTGYPADMLGLDLDLEADLSIDSIKRMEIIGELRTKIGGFSNSGKKEEAVVEQLAGIKTLNGLLQWIEEHLHQPVAEPGGTSLQQAMKEQAAVEHPVKQWSEHDIKNKLLLTVSEKTGYPTDMLGLDLDLEADLSIDSIKRMEILGELKIRLGGFGNGGQDDKMEALASIKTLNELVNWIIKNLQPAAGSSGPGQSKAITTAEASGRATITRSRFELVPAPFDVTKKEKIAGHSFAITDDGDHAVIIANALQQEGATANIISGNEPLEKYDGLIILDNPASSQRPDTLSAVALIKKLNPGTVKWICTISIQTGGQDSANIAEKLHHIQGYPGLLKCLDKEWEHTHCRSIVLHTAVPGPTLAAITLQELTHRDEPVEIIYQQGERYRYIHFPAPLVTASTTTIHLNHQSVVLVLGGAQGITSSLITRLSEEYPCRYIIVGRSSLPKQETASAAMHFNSKEDIRKQLIAEGRFQTPAEIEQQAVAIHKAGQVLQTIAALEKNGAVVEYYSLDLRNRQALSSFIEELYARYGKIDGVIHGAGLLEDKLFQQKTVESFERVFSTKITPLKVLADHLRANTRFVILFSSVAAAFGNRGQTDYAAANSVLDQYAHAWKKLIPGRVVAINWGPWKGAGMVSPTLEKEYERRGIPLIPLQQGAEVFLNELKYGNESQVLIMAE